MDLTDSPPAPASLTAGLALAAVATVAGFISYTHICALTLALHQSWMTAHLMPFAVDGQIVVGSVVLLVALGRTAWWGWLGIIPGLGESLFANWESGIAHGRVDAVWAVVAAQAFAGSSFLFERWMKSRAAGRVAGTVTVTVGCGHGVAECRDDRILDAWFHLKDCLGGDPSYRGVGLVLGVHNEIVRQVVTAVAPGGGAETETDQTLVLSVNGSAS